MNMPKRLPWIITGALWIAAWGALIVSYFFVLNRVHATTADIRSSAALAGMPLLTGYRVGHQLGLRFGWGALVLAIGPLVLASLVVLWQILDLWRAGSTTSGPKDLEPD